MVGLVRTLAADLAGTSVTANVVAPGSTDTAILEATADIYGLANAKEFSQHAYLGRLLDPREVARVVGVSVLGVVVGDDRCRRPGGRRIHRLNLTPGHGRSERPFVPWHSRRHRHTVCA